LPSADELRQVPYDELRQVPYNVVKKVGNYGEIFCGLNNLWSAGALIYAPPLR